MQSAENLQSYQRILNSRIAFGNKLLTHLKRIELQRVELLELIDESWEGSYQYLTHWLDESIRQLKLTRQTKVDFAEEVANRILENPEYQRQESIIVQYSDMDLRDSSFLWEKVWVRVKKGLDAIAEQTDDWRVSIQALINAWWFASIGEVDWVWKKAVYELEDELKEISPLLVTLVNTAPKSWS
jgi:hypothetical protein